MVWINGLARIYKKQGLKIDGERRVISGAKTTTNEIAFKIMKVTGLGYTTVISYLSSQHKQPSQYSEETVTKPRVPASQAIKSKLGEYGKRLVERHREEVLKEETPKIEKKLKLRLGIETKSNLRLVKLLD